MKRVVLGGIALLLLLVGGALICQQLNLRTEEIAAESITRAASESIIPTNRKRDSRRIRTQSKISTEAQAQSSSPMDSLTAEGLEQILRIHRIDTVYGFDGILQELREYDDKQVADAFYSLLHDGRATEFYLRTKMVQVANRFQSPHSLPLWKDLILRRIPLYSNEEEILKADEISMQAHFINFEVYNSIRNLGILAQDNSQAKDFLAEVVGISPDGRYQKFMREQAFFALREADVTYANRILKDLNFDDDLRQRIKTVGP